ncbi:CST complex subunit TEN1 [Sapajus apella]|uniref:CST complex subunit TEN1 n=1 Tax=Sapajus apella TaxID=9515 RepID=A0A6J3EW61_SAPAP|nr:CST complex subunit TEN1 [Sapajus apella]
MMLPKPGIFYLPWEVSAGQVPDGSTLRTFGRYGGSVVKARVLTCVEGMNLPLLEQAIREQRLYQQERRSGQ